MSNGYAGMDPIRFQKENDEFWHGKELKIDGMEGKHGYQKFFY